MPQLLHSVQSGTTIYEIEALHFITGSLDTPAQWKKYIDDQAATAAKIRLKVVSSTGSPDYEPVDPDVSGTQPNADNMGLIYLVSDGSPEAGTYVEWVAVEPSEGTYVWERIGTTSTDLSEYAKVSDVNASLSSATQTDAPSTNSTGSAGGQTKTTTGAGSGDATGTGSIAATITTTEAGGFTLSGSNFSFTGDTVTLTSTLKLDKHKLTPSGSIGGSQTVAAHSHTFNPATTEVLTGFSPSTATVLTGVKSTGSTAAITSISKGTVSVFNSATVVNGVLSFNTETVLNNVTSSGTADVMTGIGADGTVDAVTDFTTTATSVVTSGTVSSAGAHTIYGSSFSFSGSEIKLEHTQSATLVTDFDTLNITNSSFQPTGTISGTQTVNNHTHNITPSSATVISVKVALTDHTHNVTIASHTHTLNNHVHGITFTQIVPV